MVRTHRFRCKRTAMPWELICKKLGVREKENELLWKKREVTSVMKTTADPCKQHWALWIDIEGFSEFYDEDRAPSLLSDLALDLYKIGCGYCDGYVGNEFRERKAIFVHQFGDGFILG